MKKILGLSVLALLTACQTYVPKQYVANMYAKGTLKGYENTAAGGVGNTNCPGCHVKHFSRVKLEVREVMAENTAHPYVDGCMVSVTDSLNLINITEERYIPLTDYAECATVYEQEKSYLKAMGFAE